MNVYISQAFKYSLMYRDALFLSLEVMISLAE